MIALAPLRLTHAPYIQGILDEERDCNFIPAHMEGGKLAQKDIICFFFFSLVFIDFFAGYRKSKKETLFCLILSGATKKNLVRNTRKKQSWLCAKSSRRAHTQSVFMSLSGTWFISVCIYIYTHNTRLGPLPRSLSYMEPLGYPDKLLFRRGRPARRGIRLMKQWKSPQSAHGPAKGPIAGAQGAAKVPKQQHPLLSEKKVAAAATASLLTDIYTVVLHGKEKKPPILTKSDQMREKNFSGSFFPPFSFKEEGPFF